MATHDPRRRRIRSTRVTAAAALLTSSVAAVTLAVSTQSSLWIGASAVIAVGAGIIATRLVHSEMLRDRRTNGEQRVALTRSYDSLFGDRARDNDRFIATMTARLDNRDRTIGELHGVIRLAEKRADVAEIQATEHSRRLSQASARIVDLEDQLEVRTTELLDDLAPWQGAELETVVDLMGWEQRLIDSYTEEAASVRSEHA